MYPINIQFEWDPHKAESNLRKHGISFEQALSVFYDGEAARSFDIHHSLNEERIKIIGESGFGLLMVIYTVRSMGFIYRIISARRASRQERRDHYEEKRKN